MADTAITIQEHGHEEHRPELLHHFATAEQQFDSAVLGMWSFLLTEVLFFGGLFAAYAIYRNMYPEAFASTSQFMDVRLGGINTIVLICSSLSMALAVRASQLGQKKNAIICLLLTIFLGTVFLCIKAVEYHAKWEEHLIPGFNFQYHEHPQFEHNVQILFFLYFAMTGMHAIHMIIGFGLLTTILIMTMRNRFSSAYFTPVEMVGLYWHFVDIVWIFLFPLLYLIGHHKL